MAIEKINEDKCIGCGKCVNACSIDVIRMDKEKKKAILCYQEDCMLCEMCIMECPVDAIEFSPEKKSQLTVSWG